MVDSAKLLLEQGNVSIKEIGKEDVVVAESNCSTVRTVCWRLEAQWRVIIIRRTDVFSWHLAKPSTSDRLTDLAASCRGQRTLGTTVEYPNIRGISNKMQSYTVYFIWKLLYMFRVVPWMRWNLVPSHPR